MNDMLERLYAAKAEVLRAEEEREPYDVLSVRAEARRPERRSFARALRDAHGPAIVAEIKRASPSVGLIARNFDPAAIASDYERAGADAISVLTEADHFLGELAFLDTVRARSQRPLLRKDFLTSPYQIAQSAAYGADAVLLIVAGLDDEHLRGLSTEAARFALDVLFEVHDDDDLRRLLPLRPALIGINNRDLRTFETDLGVTEHLLPAIPNATLIVSESGVQTPQDVARLHACGAHAFLVGESLMRADDRTAFLAALKGAPVAHAAST